MTAARRLKTERHLSSAGKPNLYIEVRQRGVLQTALTLAPAKRRRVITLGSKPSCDLWVQYGRMPSAIKTFFVEGEHFGLMLEPRFSGMINTGHEFGSVAEKLRPQGALTALAAINVPLAIALATGSRGVLNLEGYDILFKVEKAAPLPKPVLASDHARRRLFDNLTQGSRLEKWPVLAAVICIGIMFVPLLAWVTAAPSTKPSSVLQLPQHVLYDFIHPEHFRYLPKIYGSSFNPDDAVPLAIKWVLELQQRWDAEDRGESYASPVPLLGDFNRPQLAQERVRRWQETVKRRHGALEATRVDPKSDRYFRFQKPYPTLVVQTSGSSAGSLYARQLSRIDGFDATYRALHSVILAEQEFLTQHYRERGYERKGLFVSPLPEARKDFEPDEAFANEGKMFAAAEGWAAFSSQRPYLLRGRKKSGRTLAEQKRNYPVPGLLQTGLLVPSFLVPRESGGTPGEAEAQLLSNTKYALGVLSIPPAPLPRGTIDQTELEAVLLDRREEVRGCYEDSLQRQADLEGTLRLGWWIDLSGKARTVQVAQSDLKSSESPRLISCLENLILSWNFPRPRHAAVRVVYPFRFVIEK